MKNEEFRGWISYSTNASEWFWQRFSGTNPEFWHRFGVRRKFLFPN